VRTNGVRCGSPSLRNRIFCYYHYKASCPPPVSCEITPVETADGIQIAIGNVLQALDNDKIEVKKAIAMLYGLQTASSNLKRTNPQPAWDEVETELGPLDQHAWHKNIAVATAERLHEEEFAARTGTTPGAGLNKSHRPSSGAGRSALHKTDHREAVSTEHEVCATRLQPLSTDDETEKRRVS
jgi:hypothetical protein